MFVSRSLKVFSASCSWAASSSNSFSHPPTVYFRISLPFVFSLSSPLLHVVGRQHSVLAVLSVEHELRLWRKLTLRAFMLFFSFVGMDSLVVLLASLVVTDDFFRLPIDSLAYRILVSLSWQSFFQYAIMLVYSVLRCILFVFGFEKETGQTAGQIGGSLVEAYWCGRERCLELIGETSLFFSLIFVIDRDFLLIILTYINIYDYFYLL